MAVTADASKGYMLGASATGMELPGVSRSTTADIEKTTTVEDEPEIFDDESEGLTAKQKSALGFIWLVSGVYSVLSEHILSKGHTIISNTNKFDNFRIQFFSLRQPNCLTAWSVRLPYARHG